MSNGAAKAFIDQGKGLLKSAKEKIGDKESGRCAVGDEFPGLVCWLAESRIIEMEEEQENVPWLKRYGINLSKKAFGPILAVLVILELTGVIDMSTFRDLIHGIPGEAEPCKTEHVAKE